MTPGPVRGILVGLAAALPLWAVIGAALWAVRQW